MVRATPCRCVTGVRSVDQFGQEKVDTNDINEKVDFFFRYRDVNGDDEVSWIEWMETKAFLMLDMDNRLHEALSEQEIVALQNIFEAIDLDADGQITMSEAREYYLDKYRQMVSVGMIKPMDYYAMNEIVTKKVQHFFRFHDRDQNQTISMPEFQAEESKFVIMDRHRRQTHAAQGSVLKLERELQASANLDLQPLVLDHNTVEHAKLIFTEYDINDDGLISAAELKTMLRKLKVKNVSQKAIQKVRTKAFKAADLDSSGSLDFHEFLSIYSFFYVRDLDFDVFLQAGDGIAIGEAGGAATYLTEKEDTNSLLNELEDARNGELEQAFDPKRSSRSRGSNSSWGGMSESSEVLTLDGEEVVTVTFECEAVAKPKQAE
eukprot:TRINITY_DN2188_c0_g1_i2.p1 TRINITY_DN2188_c0_g1~~TRINITY_DN2188_c0_g1_i2.p1  ORF type:complete len:377 (-),score=100.63 TRINITY_DN2188_c0_g1_i2:227-1357(-)